MHDLRQTYHRLRHRFNVPMVLLGDEAQVEAPFSPFGDIGAQYRCAVCVKRTIGLEISLDAPGGTPR